MLKHGILGLLNYHQMSGYEIMLVISGFSLFFLERPDQPDLPGAANFGNKGMGQ